MFARFDARFTGPMDEILESVCLKLQLSNTQEKLARQHYIEVGTWLEQEGSSLRIYRPTIFPQGSLAMGTTNKPDKKDEYDLDFVCLLDRQYTQITPTKLKAEIANRISEHSDYKSRMEICERCIRLTYKHNFHLDIVPACKRSEIGKDQICIPDRQTRDGSQLTGWRDTNPKGYLEWFERCCRRLVRQDSRRMELLADPESMEEKAELKFAVQLMKRCRDIYFRDVEDLAPASIVLSTLAAQHHPVSESVYACVAGILTGISHDIEAAGNSRIQVVNVANSVHEDLAERWDRDPQAYPRFKSWIANFSKLWQELQMTKGRHHLAGILGQLFDHFPTQMVLDEHAQTLERLQSDGNLLILPGGSLGYGVASGGRPIPRNTFYGENPSRE